MKVKLSDSTQSQIEVHSVSQIFNSDSDSTFVTITINRPTQDFNYYKNLFTDAAVQTITVIDSRGHTITTLTGSEIDQISSNIQEDNAFISVQIKA